MARYFIFFVALVLLAFVLVNGANNRRPNVIVRASNLTSSMQADAVRIGGEAFTKFNGYSKSSRSMLARHIRDQFDRLHGPSWQCILGRDYALAITSENERRIVFDVDKVAVLLFKGKC